MDIDAFMRAPTVVQIHALAAITALLIGTIMLMRRKGDKMHRVTGRVWGVLMAITAFSGLFIFEIRILGPFSPIHLLCFVVLASLIGMVRAVRAGDIDRHRRIATGLYFGGLVVAGAFTFLPGRLSHDVFIVPWLSAQPVLPPWWPLAGAAIGISGAIVVWIIVGRGTAAVRSDTPTQTPGQ